jgi:succinate dehydrogenase / fumarate reductase cytochrome b subunit
MTTRRSFLASLVTTKLIIGATGVLLFLYLIVHIIGNLMVFLGRDTYNAYAHFLTSNPLIIPIEIGLLLIFLIHLVKAIRMTLQNQSARPVAYARKEYAGGASQKSLASSSMILTGLAILIFVPIHVWQFKFRAHYDLGDGLNDLYRIEFENLSSPVTVGLYVIMMVLVGLHLWHGVGSSFQSLGVSGPRLTPLIRNIGKVCAVIIAGGFIVIALWVFLTGLQS